MFRVLGVYNFAAVTNYWQLGQERQALRNIWGQWGFYSHLILTGTSIYSNQGGQNTPANKACPHFFRKYSARPRMKCNIYYVCYYEYYKPQYNGPNLLSFSLQYISYKFLYKNQMFSNSPKTLPVQWVYFGNNCQIRKHIFRLIEFYQG